MRTEWQEGDSTDVSSWETSEEEDIREIPPTETNPKKRVMEKTKKDTIMNLMAELMMHIEQDQELRKMMMIMYKRNEKDKESTETKRRQNNKEDQKNREREITRNIKNNYWKKQREEEGKQQISQYKNGQYQDSDMEL
ncbi:hypothetical protein PV327_006171 [Microctonus hyperodae]|uniref:Uncharacterized protein n=1 Tax=Microctonus hyperodae TaxID=165561 RepID=A0AA39F3U4_MICHY|nr:hypothetical protein PV327_006171 [Microctonus hyperodae]